MIFDPTNKIPWTYLKKSKPLWEYFGRFFSKNIKKFLYEKRKNIAKPEENS